MTPGMTPLPSHPATAQRLRHPHGRGGGLHPGRLPHQRRPAGDGERGAAAESSPPNPGCVPAPPPSPGDHLSSLLVCCGGRGALGPSAAPRPPPQTLLVEFYRGAPDLVKFQELWSHDQTYLDKLKVGTALSLSSALPTPLLPAAVQKALLHPSAEQSTECTG